MNLHFLWEKFRNWRLLGLVLFAAKPVNNALHLPAREFLVFAEGWHSVVLIAVEPFVCGIAQEAQHPLARAVTGQIRR